MAEQVEQPKDESPKTFEENREKSAKENLLDEQKIKVINAQFTVKSSGVEKGDTDAEQKHLGEMAEQMIKFISGVETHYSNDFVFIKEKMRSLFNETTIVRNKDNEITNGREILTMMADLSVELVAKMLKDAKWVNEQMALMYQFIDEQQPESLGKKVKSAPKKIAMLPVSTAQGALEVLGLKRGKRKVK